ncbi:hypothetical protein [Burkholderia multivorans]|uniref:hypothetical protein n=1 Tax=Burkholderia multivorans TaxID=87883 RepID=UPI000A8D3952|nr:hypothetical protein [Burkholderia multivorans]
MANNNFKPFAAAAGANVMAQADYEALAALLTGFQSGTAQSAQLNKVWRQSSIMAAVLGQFIVDLTGQDAVDDGTTATLLANLKMAVQAQSAAVVGQARNLTMSVTAASSTATLNADEIIVGSSLGGQKYLLKQFSKTINLAAAGAGGMDTGTAPASGYVALYAIYNPVTGASALLATDATPARVPEVYGGANMPSGFTASALVSVWPTDSSRRFILGYQRERKISVVDSLVLSTTSVVSTPVSLSIASAIPKNANRANFHANITSSTSQNLFLNVFADSSQAGFLGGGVVTTNFGYVGNVMIVTPQTIWYTTGTTSATFQLFVNGYDF